MRAFRVVRVVESRMWVNQRTGATASLFGAVPWMSESERADWTVVTRGWTWELANGTVGLGRVPAKTKAEAEEVMRRVNAR